MPAQAPPPEPETARRKGVYSTAKSAQRNLSKIEYEEWVAKHASKAEEERDPKSVLSTVPMPSSIKDVVDRGMASFLAMDRSGQSSPATQQEPVD